MFLWIACRISAISWRGNLRAVAVRGVQSHRVSQPTVLDDAKDRHQQALQQQPPVAAALKGMPQFSGRGRPVKDLRVVEPHQLSRHGVQLEGVLRGDADKRVVVVARPSHGDAFEGAHFFHLCLVVRAKQHGPSEHVAHVVREVRAVLFMGAGVPNALVEKLLPQLRATDRPPPGQNRRATFRRPLSRWAANSQSRAARAGRPKNSFPSAAQWDSAWALRPH